MKRKITTFAMFLAVTLFADAPQVPEPETANDLSSHITFKVDFENGIDAAAARGNARQRMNPKVANVPGVSGKAVTVEQDEKNRVYLRYAMQDNLNISEPGTLLFWLKITEPDNIAKGPVCFFSTDYIKTGYMPFQLELINGKKTMCLYFIGFEGMGRPAARVVPDWKPGEWVQWGIAWDGLEYSIYFNGNLVKSLTLPRKPKQEELNKGFTFSLHHGFAFDEVQIFDIMLTPEQIKQLYLDNAGK
ncbi:MAG: LamG domain-containing protein [Victivallales bacterium]|jgi:hypothetical protein|nr:LamG domain-containing protein [Victivallales bacterium]